MIEKIKITKKNKTIRKDFELPLTQMTVITGENNSGKTNFIEAVVKKDKETEKFTSEFLTREGNPIIPEIVYISDKNISPSDDELSSSKQTSSLVSNLSKLFSNIGIEFELTKKDEISKVIKDLIIKTNDNLENLTGKETHTIELDPVEKIDSKIVVQKLIGDIFVFENGSENKRKLSELGQGTQRVIVVSVLKAYADILVEKEIVPKEQVLIVFEEPEIYLHPRLKRVLNATLWKIAEQEKHQVIVTTHDPYFAFLNFEGKGKSIFSFEKKNGITVISDKDVVYGIEDELLFIFLYSFLLKEGKDLSTTMIGGFERRKYFRNDENGDKKEEDHNDLTYIRHQIHHLGDNPYTVGLVSEKPEDCNDKNYYTEKELTDAIKKMSEMLGV